MFIFLKSTVKSVFLFPSFPTLLSLSSLWKSLNGFSLLSEQFFPLPLPIFPVFPAPTPPPLSLLQVQHLFFIDLNIVAETIFHLFFQFPSFPTILSPSSSENLWMVFHCYQNNFSRCQLFPVFPATLPPTCPCYKFNIYFLSIWKLWLKPFAICYNFLCSVASIKFQFRRGTLIHPSNVFQKLPIFLQVATTDVDWSLLEPKIRVRY